MNNSRSNDQAVTQSHSKIEMEQRRVHFAYTEIETPELHVGNPLMSAFWVALSSIFPVGEEEFIASVRYFEKDVEDPKLKADIANFIAQEAHHSFQHKQINRHLTTLGYATNDIETFMHKKMAQRRREWSPKKRLMRTASAEHVTAVMSHFLLDNADALKDIPESLRDLFTWHSVEEIEHKSVAFDVYQYTIGAMPALKWHYAKFVFFEFPLNLTLITRYLLKSRGHKTTWSERRATFKFLFGKNGLYRSGLKQYLSFFKPSFHPWQHDDSALVSNWKKKNSAAPAPILIDN